MFTLKKLARKGLISLDDILHSRLYFFLFKELIMGGDTGCRTLL